MTELRFASAYEHAAEQAMSDEHVVGALPDDASHTLLDWQLARLREAASESSTEEEFEEWAQAIRVEARSVADAAAEAGDDSAALSARLGQAQPAPPPERPADASGAAPTPVSAESPIPPAAEPAALARGLLDAPTAPRRRRRSRSRQSRGEHDAVAQAAAAVATEAAIRGGGAVRRRPWLGVLLAVLLIAVAIVVLVVILKGREADQPTSQAPPLPGGGWYEAMFTTPQRTGTPAAGSPGRLDQRLVQLLNGAERSIEVAAYDFGLDNVADALIAARKRGVTVRVVSDSDNRENPALKKLTAAGIPVVLDERRALMHHKFAVIDGRTVMTGSWNFAERDTFRHDNNSVVWNSPELAQNFTTEFNKMFDTRRFGPTKPKGVPNPVVEQDGARVETYFASEQQVDPVILSRLRGARSSIAFLAFSFTLDDLGDALQERRGGGVGVWGVIESTGSDTAFSEFGRLRTLQPARPAPPFPGCKQGPAVLQDGNPFLLHHKVFVIDQRTVIFGSFNFTANAAEDNDEALLVVDDPALAARFLAEFCRVYNIAVDRGAAGR